MSAWQLFPAIRDLYSRHPEYVHPQPWEVQHVSVFARVCGRPGRRSGDLCSRRGGERRLSAVEACSMGKDVILATASPAALQTARQVKGAA